MEFPIYCINQKNSNQYKISQDLWKIDPPPLQLWIQGTEHALKLLQSIPSQGLTIVGTRDPQLRSLQLTEKMIQNLSGSHLIILSGLARGIDTRVHAAALRAGLPTIAILGTGLHLTYPKENIALRQEILRSNGLIISEIPPNISTQPYEFIKRNRLLAGWSQATLIIEAGQRSGALNTARWARDFNRMCFAVPCYPGDSAFSGNQILLDRDHSIPFWGIHSLGVVWLNLATYDVPSLSLQQKSMDLFCQTDSAILVAYVQQCVENKGGIQIQDLCQWAISQGWDVQRFFVVLQQALQNHQLIDHSAILITP